VWEALEINALGQINRFATGNGLQTTNTYYPGNARLHTVQTKAGEATPIQDLEYGWDALGNLNYRKKWIDRVNSIYLSESFGYDVLNRLESIHLNEKETGWHRYDEAGLGNMMEKKADNNYVFANGAYDGSRPHALTSAHVNDNLRAYTSDDQAIGWTSFDQPEYIEQGSNRLEFTYGHHRQRIRQQLKNGGGETTKTFAGNCEFVSIDGQQYAYTYLSGPAGLFGIHVQQPDGPSELFYIHTDHLGSLHTITDENGDLLQELSFDAWGNRRNPATWTMFNESPETALFDRGFTGHEHLYGFQLINMNGRLYDPVVSRMLSPDNYVQSPDFSQSFNRYSYAWNNPLVYTDPSGEVLMAPFFLMAMVADYTSNLINGIHDPLGNAYSNVTSTITGMNNAGRIEIYQNKNTSITLGLDPFNLGVSIDATYQTGDVSHTIYGGYGFFGANYGVSRTIKLGDFSLSHGVGYNSGVTNLLSKNPEIISGFNAYGGVSYSDRNRNQRFSFGLSSFYGSHPQNNWFVGYGRGDFSFSMTNDAFRGSDWYRTAAAEIGIGEVSFGFNLFTTEPPMSEYNSDPQIGTTKDYISRWGFNRKGTYSSGERVYAGLYLGYRNGNRVSRFGIDGPGVQEWTQNFIHSKYFPLVNSPYFDTRLGSPPAMFLQGGYMNPFSLYPF
jgi:RHS repeat-associated protein